MISTLTGPNWLSWRKPACPGMAKAHAGRRPACAHHTDIYLHSDHWFTKSFVLDGAESYERLPAYIVKQAL